MIHKEFETKNKIYATNHKYITRGGSNCFPTSWVKLQMWREKKTLGLETPKPKCELPGQIQGDLSSPRRVERENGLGSWSGWVRRG